MMRSNIDFLLEQIELFKQDEHMYLAPDAQKFFGRISYLTSIQYNIDDFEESKATN